MEYTLLIKEFRTLREMTQEQLALKSKVKQSYISQLEKPNPKKSPTVKTIFNIALALGVCPHKLIKYNINCVSNCFHGCQESFL